jgi:hypothetical protein
MKFRVQLEQEEALRQAPRGLAQSGHQSVLVFLGLRFDLTLHSEQRAFRQKTIPGSLASLGQIYSARPIAENTKKFLPP